MSGVGALVGVLSCVRRPVTVSGNLGGDTGQTGSHQSSRCGGGQIRLRGRWALNEGPLEDPPDGSCAVPKCS